MEVIENLLMKPKALFLMEWSSDYNTENKY